MKAELEAIWNGRLEHGDNICIYEVTARGSIICMPGEERKPTVGKSAEKFMRRVRKHWGPAPMTYCGDAKLKMPDWLRDNYKRNCPNNYSELIKLYGKSNFGMENMFDKLAASD